MRTTTTILLCTLALLAPSACSRGDEDEAGGNDQQPAAHQQKTSAIEPPRAIDEKPKSSSVDAVPMRTGMRIAVRTLLRGVPVADKPVLDVKSWQLGPAEVAYQVPFGSAGTVTVSEEARSKSNAFIAPMYWSSPSAHEAPGPMIWLSADTFKALHGTGATTIAPGAIPGAGPAPGAPLALTKTGEGSFTLTVEGRRLDVPVILASDESGTQYKILNAPDNPLVMSVRYVPGSRVGGAARDEKLLDVDGYDVYEIGPTPAAPVPGLQKSAPGLAPARPAAPAAPGAPKAAPGQPSAPATRKAPAQ